MPPELVTVDDRVVKVERYFGDQFKRIESSLPAGVDPSRFTRIVVTEFQRNPDLFACMGTAGGKASVWASVMTAAQLGLEIGSHLGQAFMIPRKSKKQGGAVMCSFQLGYQGLIQLAYNSGVLADIRCRPVYKGERFEYVDGIKPRVFHVPTDQAKGDEDLHAVYCILKMTSGVVHPEVMYRWELDRVLSKSGAFADSLMWKEWKIEGFLKTVLKRALKYCPKSTSMRAVGRAIAADDGLVELGPEIDDSGALLAAVSDSKPAPPPDLEDRNPLRGVTLEGHYIVKRPRSGGEAEWICQCGLVMDKETEVSEHEKLVSTQGN